MIQKGIPDNKHKVSHGENKENPERSRILEHTQA